MFLLRIPPFSLLSCKLIYLSAYLSGESLFMSEHGQHSLPVDGIILVAGKGTRMNPFSSIISKPMLPICNKPLLALLAERMSFAGFHSIILVVSPVNESLIRTYFSQHPLPYDTPVHFVLQKEALGTGHALLLAQSAVSTDVAFSLAGDNYLSTAFLRSIAEYHLHFRPSVTIALKEVPLDSISQLSTVHLTADNRITKIIEKPSPEEVLSPITATAAYVFEYELFDILQTIPKSKRGEYEVPTAFEMLLASNKTLLGYFADEWDHISNPQDLWRFNMLEATGNIIAPTAQIKAGVECIHTIIGDQTIIGEDSVLDHCLVLPNTTIPPHSKYTNAVLANSATGQLEILQMSSNLLKSHKIQS